MAVMVLLDVQAKAGMGDDLVATFTAVLPDTRTFEGFLDVVVHQNQDDKDNLLLVERWVTRAAFEKYFGWRQETGVLDQLVAACAGPPSIRYYDITDA